MQMDDSHGSSKDIPRPPSYVFQESSYLGDTSISPFLEKQKPGPAQNPGFWRSYGNYWTQILNYTGRSSKQEYRVPLLLFFIILAVLFFGKLGITIIGLWLLINLIASLSLTTRRYRDMFGGDSPGMTFFFVFVTYVIPIFLPITMLLGMFVGADDDPSRRQSNTKLILFWK